MKSIEQVIAEIDSYKIYDEMRKLVASIPVNGQITGDMASVLQTKCWLVTSKVTKLLSDLEVRVAFLERQREDILSDQKALSEEKSEAGKERVAKATPEYRAIADELAVAKVAMNKVLNQKKFFDNGVYVMRSKQEKEKRDWQSTPTTET